jgi:hypothetical protein
MKKIIVHSFAIIIYFSISACSSLASFSSMNVTPSPSEINTQIPTATPLPSPTSSIPKVPALVKTTLEFYRNGKTYEIIVGYDVGKAFFYATPRPEFPTEKWEKAGANSAELERYGDLDYDGETEFIVSLLYCGAGCAESIQIYEYDVKNDKYYVADEFYTAVNEYTDINSDGSLELITTGFCSYCRGGGYSALEILRYENGKFVDVTTEFPELIQKDAEKFLELSKANEDDDAYVALPVYLYDMYRLGKMNEARPIFDNICADVVKQPLMPYHGYSQDCVEIRTSAEKLIKEFKLKP